MSDTAPNTTNTNTNTNTNTTTATPSSTSTSSLHPELPTLTGTSVASTATYSDQHGVSALDTRVFYDIDAEADIERISTIQSLCMNCREDGTTRLLVTRIPYFRDIVIMSFDCEHCGFRSSEMQPANEVAEKTIRYVLKVDPNDAAATKQDLNRQVIKSESCSIMIPELEFEIPSTSARGEINTVEGVLINIADSLEAQQPNRELSDPAVAARIAEIIATFRGMAQGTKPFTFILDDLAGNSFLENPNAPNKDPRVEVTHRMRTRQENIDLGLQVEDETPEEKEQREAQAQHSTNASQPQGITIAPKLHTKMLDTYFNVTDRVAIIPGTCQSCRADCETRMCITELPHFKDVVIMVTDCESCGYRDAEVKPAGSVSEKGTRITLKVEKSSDLARDLMKSETAGVIIPELELELDAGTLGGKYTTIEGLLVDIKSQLSESNPFVMGDSADYGLNDQKSKFANFLKELERCISGERTFTLIVDDPLGNIYVYNPCAPNDDPQMKIEKYTRSFEQDEELGLNDINVDHYLDEEEQKQFDAEIAAEMEAAKLTLAQYATHVDEKHKAEAALAAVDERHIAVAAVAAGTGAIEGEEEADEWQKKAVAAGVNHRGWKPGGLITKEDEDRVAKMS